jgi:hypothetical protein
MIKQGACIFNGYFMAWLFLSTLIEKKYKTKGINYFYAFKHFKI